MRRRAREATLNSTGSKKQDGGSSSSNHPSLVDRSIPLTTELLTPSVWRSVELAANRRADSASPLLPPPFKVGSREMYKSFPAVYEALMRHHDCSAVERRLCALIDRLQAPGTSTAASFRVLDLGCGSGRIEEMLIRSSKVDEIYAYDKEQAILERCIVSSVTAAAAAVPSSSDGVSTSGQPYRLCFQPTAGDDLSLCRSIAIGGCWRSSSSDAVGVRDTSLDQKNSSAGPDENIHGKMLRMCVRPVSFSDIQLDFLRRSHHPTFQLVVCAWSLSYVVREAWGGDRWHASLDSVISAMLDHLDCTHSPAAVVVIETLGHGVCEPTRRSTLHERLEEVWGFQCEWDRTDYSFDSVEEAVAYTNFFFGREVSQQLGNEGARVMTECTGMWVKWIDQKKEEAILTS